MMQIVKPRCFSAVINTLDIYSQVAAFRGQRSAQEWTYAAAQQRSGGVWAPPVGGRPVVPTECDNTLSRVNIVIVNGTFGCPVQSGKNTRACPFNRGNCATDPRHLPVMKSKATTSSRATQ